MTKKAKTKTKHDEAPPTSVTSDKQSTATGPGPGADQQTAAAPPPQPSTPAGAGLASPLPAAVQTEAVNLQDSPAAAATSAGPSPAPATAAAAAFPPAPTTIAVTAPTPIPTAAPLQAPTASAAPAQTPISATVSPPAPTAASAPAQTPIPAAAPPPAPATATILSPAPITAATSSPVCATVDTSAPIPIPAVALPSVSATTAAPAQTHLPTAALPPDLNTAAASPPDPTTAAAPPPVTATTAARTTAPFPTAASPSVPAIAATPSSTPVPTAAPPPAFATIADTSSAAASTANSAATTPAAVAQASAQLGVAGSSPDKGNASNNEPKPSALLQEEPVKKQLTSHPEANRQPLPKLPIGDLSLSPTSSEKSSGAPEDKSRMEKDSKSIAPPQVQVSGRGLTDKNLKVSSSSSAAVPNGQPSKKPAEKLNKRQASKESVPSNSVLKGDPTIKKPSKADIKQTSLEKVTGKPASSSEPKIAKDNTLPKVEEVTATQSKDERNKNQLSVSVSETLTKQNNETEAHKKKTDQEPPKPMNSNRNIAAVAEDIKVGMKPETSKDSVIDEKTVDSDPATQENKQNPSSSKSDSSEKINKNTAPKKNKQKNEASASKTEGAPKTKEEKPADKGGKKDVNVAATGAQSSQEVIQSPNLSTAMDNSKKPSSNILPDTMSKLPTLEAVASDPSTQAKEDGNKLSKQTKVKQDPKDKKECTIKDDGQSKSSSKKKNRQQKKSVSEDIKSSGENDFKSKKDENKKSAPACQSKDKESNRVPAAASEEKNRMKVLGESSISGPKDSAGKPSMAEQTSLVSGATKDSHLKAAENDSPGKKQVTIPESQSEEQSASQKKKRNRHKKKNKAGDAENSTDENVEGGKQQDTHSTAVGDERKFKEKQRTITSASNKAKGQQKDSQVARPSANKGTQPVSTTIRDGQASGVAPAEQASETTAQTTPSKKRNRRKKKGTSDVEENSEASQPQECKSVDSKETSVAKPEEQKSKVNNQPTQTKTDETPKKKTDSKSTIQLEKPQQQDGQITEGTEDQSENFVEVKSKNKRNKKKKLDSAEAKEDNPTSLSPFNNVSKVVPENIIDVSVNSSKGKMETENTGGNPMKEMTNKVAAPKISQEAREQKMLNKKLAERAQLKIKKQIESNALSEVEISEKYLETITKNLRELTKLRSSRLEDVLQKSADGAITDEEFEYEYAPVQRNTFLATTCHVCKESKPKDTMKICEQCHLMSYCSEEHRESDWAAHRDLCQAINEMCRERGTDNLYSPAVGLSAEDYRGYRINVLLECSAILNRQLEPYEQEIILYPNVCHTCHLPSAANLHTCDSCNMVSFCSPEHRPPNHDVWCHDLQLYKSLIIYQSRNGIINPQLPVFLPESFQPPNGDMQSDLRTVSGGIDASPLERAVLSEIATGPLTALFALHKSNKVSDTTEKMVIHFVGAEWSFEMERADKWEAFLLHLVPSLKALVLVFVGPEVCNLPPEALGLVQKQSRPCLQCQEKGRTVEVVIAPQLFYHEYAASQDYIAPSIICAYNAGLYRPNGHKEVDSWADTVAALLRDPGVPVTVTSYTAEEVLKDAERLQQYRPLNFVVPPSQNPYRSLRPNRNFASDDVTPVIFKNYYIMISTSLTQ